MQELPETCLVLPSGLAGWLTTLEPLQSRRGVCYAGRGDSLFWAVAFFFLFFLFFLLVSLDMVCSGDDCGL